MVHAVKISEELFEHAKINAKVFHRSAAGQIEYWAKIGQLVEQNPDLPFSFVQDILITVTLKSTYPESSDKLNNK